MTKFMLISNRVKYGKRFLKGVHDLISTYIAPQYKQEKATHKPKGLELQSSKPKFEIKQYRYYSKKKKIYNAKERGTKTDDENTKTIEYYHKYSLPSNFFLYARIRDEYCYKIPADIIVMCNSLSLSCRQVWMSMNKLGLTPIATQVPVGYLPAKRGTPVDIVAKDKNNHYVLLEIKDGYHSSWYYNSTGHTLNPPFQDRTDSMANQNQIQLYLTRLFYEQTYPDHIISNAYIIRVNSTGYDIHQQAEWLQKYNKKVILRYLELLIKN